METSPKMSNRRRRGKNFSTKEEVVLVELVEEHISVVANKKSDAATWKQKEQTWKAMAKQFTARTGVEREWKALREKFDKLKRRTTSEIFSDNKSDVGQDESTINVAEKIAKIMVYTSEESKNLFDSCDGSINNVHKESDITVLDDAFDSNLDFTNDALIKQEMKPNVQEFSQNPLSNCHTLTTRATSNSPLQQQQEQEQADRPIEKCSEAAAKRKRTLEDEQIKLVLIQQEFHKCENLRAEERHQQEIISLKLKNELLQIEILERRVKLNAERILTNTSSFKK